MAASRFHKLTGAALAATLASAAVLAGCEEHHAGPADQASAPAVRPDALAGAPDALAPPPPADVAPPPAYAPPPPSDAGPPPAVPSRPGDRDVVYDLGPVVRPRDTMAPIPNPAEPAYGRVHRRVYAGRAPVAAPRPVHHRHARTHPTWTAAHAAPSARPAPPARAAHPTPLVRTPSAKPTSPHAAPSSSTTGHPKPAAATAPHAAAAAATGHPAPPPREAKPLSSKPAPGAKTAAGATATAAASADRSDKLSALQGALKDAVGRAAVLNVPELKPDQPADVTLTLPADFAATVRDQAGKQGLQDAAASVNMTALLSGDGYAVAPDETQSQPLTVGQPTEFHWTVTAQQGAKGPLHADVGADLLGGGDQALQLGSVAPTGKGGLHISPRAWGAGLLVLLAIAVFAWLSRGGRASAGERRRQRNSTSLYQRPLDMRSPPTDPSAGDRQP